MASERLREGFRRVAIATAVVYWIVAAMIVIGTWWSEMTVFTPSTYRDVFQWSQLGEATTAAAMAAFWCAVVYYALLYILRGVRWVVRGFLAQPT